MKLSPAPYFDDVAHPDISAQAYYAHAKDGTRLRLAYWPVENAQGTVLIFQGRTEYIEKYSDAAATLAKLGYASLAIDFRGQGLSDRFDAARRLGHVERFSDYQHDVDVLREAVTHFSVPQPLFLLCHSMGGCIGLEALHRGLPVKAAAFSAPMWGMNLSPATRAFAWGLSTAASYTGFGKWFAPTPAASAEPAGQPFQGNLLTTDPEMFAWMQNQVKTHKELFCAGPSLRWLNQALREMLRLSRLPAPDVPCETWLGTNERIVEQDAIHIRMASWAKGRLELVEGAEHEVLVEKAETRARFFKSIDRLFQAQI